MNLFLILYIVLRLWQQLDYNPYWTERVYFPALLLDRMNSIQIFTGTLSWLILLISIIGNVTLIIALKHHFSRSSRLYICLMFNLAAADIVFVLSSIPFNFVERLYAPRFPFGPALCKLLMPFQTMAAMTSIFTVVTLSCQRYFMIVRPSEDQHEGERRTLFITFLCLWLLPVVFAAIPLAVALRYEDGVCAESWSDIYKRCFTVYLTMIQYVGPLGVIAWCNGRAVLELRRQAKGFRLLTSSKNSAHCLNNTNRFDVLNRPFVQSVLERLTCLYL